MRRIGRDFFALQGGVQGDSESALRAYPRSRRDGKGNKELIYRLPQDAREAAAINPVPNYPWAGAPHTFFLREVDGSQAVLLNGKGGQDKSWLWSFRF